MGAMERLIMLQKEHDGLVECSRKQQLAIEIDKIVADAKPTLSVWRNGVEYGYMIEEDDIWYLQFKNGVKEEIGFNKADAKIWLNINGYFVKSNQK